MKFLPLVPLALAALFASCTAEATTSAANAAANAANAASSAAGATVTKLFDQVKTSLAGVTNAEQAKAAAGTLGPVIEQVTTALKGVTGSWPAELTKAADGVRDQVTRLSGMADLKGSIGGILEKITALLPKK